MRNGSIPPEVRAAIVEQYRLLADRLGVENPSVAVRSSATAEDLPEASFAGMQDTFLNQVGIESVVNAVRNVWASFAGSYAKDRDGRKRFNNKSVFYRIRQRALTLLKLAYGKGFDDLEYETRRSRVQE